MFLCLPLLSLRLFTNLSVLTLWNLLGFLWMNSYIHGIGMTTMAGAVSSYYWQRDKSNTPKHALLDAWQRAMKHNAGSVAAGAFLIAIFQSVRMILDYLNRKARQIKSKFICIDIFLRLIRCVILTIEVLLHFISKKTFIIIGMCGTSFLASAAEATSLVYSRATSVANINVVSETILFLGKLFVVFTSCIFLFFHLERTTAYQPLQESELNTQVGPLVFCFCLSFFCANGFFYVYDTVIDTMLLCYCYDVIHIENEHFFDKKQEARIKYWKEITKGTIILKF
jgi:solute carrier family 44 protein 1 (choline transporter-like protein)